MVPRWMVPCAFFLLGSTDPCSLLFQEQVFFGTALGAIWKARWICKENPHQSTEYIDLVFSKLMKLGYRKSLIDRESYIAQDLALAIFTIGVAIILEADDLLAAFAAGSTISWGGKFIQTEDDVFASVIDDIRS